VLTYRTQDCPPLLERGTGVQQPKGALALGKLCTPRNSVTLSDSQQLATLNGKQAGGGIKGTATTELCRRRQRDRPAEQGTHTGVRTAAGSCFTAVSAFAETPPVLTARDEQHETQCALGTPLPRCLGSSTERASGPGAVRQWLRQPLPGAVAVDNEIGSPSRIHTRG
jgi:hypothetical protein